MKLIIEISENIYNTIMSDVMPDAGQMSAIITRIYQGIPYKERPQGEWIHSYITDNFGECSNCHTQMPITNYFNFCPNCGAKMTKEAENE